jgi:transposase
MEISETQYQHIAHCLPVQRGNVRISNLQVLNAILYVAEHGCSWRALPEHFGPWHTVYTRMMRWAKSGVLDQVFETMQARNLIQIRIEAVSLDAPLIQPHSDGAGPSTNAVPKPSTNPAASGSPKFIWLPRVIAAQSLPDSSRAKSMSPIRVTDD